MFVFLFALPFERIFYGLQSPSPAECINMPDNDGNTAAHYLAMGGDADVMELLVTHGADLTRYELGSF